MATARITGSLGAECQTLHRGNRLLSRRWKWLPVAFIIKPPYIRGLVLVRHRLAAALAARNLERIRQVHEASARLPQPATRDLESGQDKRNPPTRQRSEGSSTASLLGRLSWSGTA